jgi:beta-RFAP synthase
MFSFGHARERQFGGVGVMIDRPGLEIAFRSSERLTIQGPLAERAERVATAWARQHGGAEPNCEIDLVRASPEHAGLGTGTQLALAVAAGLNALHDQQSATAEALATQVGRGERSAIGTHGFLHGGLLVEAGKLPGEALSPLVARIELPSSWRFVLMRLPERGGLSGTAEHEAFAQLPPVPRRLTAQLCRQVLLQMLPAAQRGDFSELGESIYQFGRTAGMCFAELQGGAFASEQIEQLVDELRDDGIRGVGQSSWGPTVFALLESQARAEQLVHWIKRHDRFGRAECEIASPANRGAEIVID